MNLRCHLPPGARSARGGAGIVATASPQATTDFTLRKQVDVETTCLKCHGQMNTVIMGLPGPWPESKASVRNGCLTCHAISARPPSGDLPECQRPSKRPGRNNADTCYGCHGGRAWYRIAYPIRATPGRHAGRRAGLGKGQPTQSEARFQLPATAAHNLERPWIPNALADLLNPKRRNFLKDGGAGAVAATTSGLVELAAANSRPGLCLRTLSARRSADHRRHLLRPQLRLAPHAGRPQEGAT